MEYTLRFHVCPQHQEEITRKLSCSWEITERLSREMLVYPSALPLNTTPSMRRPTTPSETQFYVFRVKPSDTSLPPSLEDVILAASLTLRRNQCCFGMNCRGLPVKWTSFTTPDTSFGGEFSKLRDGEHITEETIEQWRLILIQNGWPETTYYLSLNEDRIIVFVAHVESGSGLLARPSFSTLMGRD